MEVINAFRFFSFSKTKSVRFEVFETDDAQLVLNGSIKYL